MSEQTWQVIVGDARTQLADLPPASVQCVVTSPPYFGLRDYKVDGQIGVETTPERYALSLVMTFNGVRDVLRDDGTVFLNLGDSYMSQGGTTTQIGPNAQCGNTLAKVTPREGGTRERIDGYKTKDLIGVPWLVAFALRADGWYLRSDIIWRKPNCMPESVQDRPTRSHEYVFLLTKSKRYAYDANAIRQPYAASTLQEFSEGYDGEATKDYATAGVQNASEVKRRLVDKQRGHSRRHAGFNDRWDAMTKEEQMQAGSNARSVWDISPEPSSLPHFAMMPKELARRCIRAGCPQSLGPSAIVLDPFAGSGTTGVVALEEGRSFIGIELNPEYAAIARSRCADVSPLLAREAQPLVSPEREQFICGKQP